MTPNHEQAMYILGNKLSELLEYVPIDQLNKTFYEVVTEYRRRGIETPLEKVTKAAIRNTGFCNTRGCDLAADRDEELEMYKIALEYFAREGGQPARDIIKNLLSYGGAKNDRR